MPWWRSPFVLVAAACVCLIYGFLHFASEVVERDTAPFDRAVRDWVFAHRPPWSVDIARGITTLGSRTVLIVAAAIVVVLLIVRGARLRPLLVAVVPLCLIELPGVLRDWYRIPRPPGGIAADLSFGFPSGHTTGSTVLALVIGYVLARELGARRLGWTIALLIPLAVGISRVYLDVHWASDVIGGWLIGSICAVAICALYERAFRRGRAKASASGAA